MKKNIYTVAFCLLLSSKLFSQGICDPGGNIIIYSNYDGGTLNIDIDQDIPNIRIGICSYESVDINITGAYIDNVVEVLYAGYDDDGTTNVSGVSPGIVDILLYPPATLSDPDGYPYIICAYDCDTLYVPGGCNTVEQVTDYFLTELSGSFRYSYMQYGVWSGTYEISDGGNCCYGGYVEPTPVDAGVSAITAPASGCGLGTDETITVSIFNYGDDVLSSIPVSYILDGGTPVTETAVTTIGPGSSASYSFATTANLTTPGAHTITAYTSIAGDADDSNDDFTTSVNSLATPAVDLGADQTACDELEIDAGNPGSTYAWNTGASTQEIVVTTTGGYSVTVTNPVTGCSATDFINVEIIASPIASFTYTITGFEVAFTNTSTIGTYSWNFGDGSAVSTLASPTHTYTTDGTYTVTLSVTNACGTDIYTAIISTVNSDIGQLEFQNLASMFPNPVSEELNICFNESLKEELQLHVYSLVGSKLNTLYLTPSLENCYTFNLSSFAEGFYIIRLESTSGIASAIIQRIQ